MAYGLQTLRAGPPGVSKLARLLYIATLESRSMSFSYNTVLKVGGSSF